MPRRERRARTKKKTGRAATASRARGKTPPKDRIERDTFGPINVPADRLWGAQTQRSLGNFRISGERMPPALIRALVLVKKATALVNMDLGVLEPTKGKAIVAAADEVLADRASEILGGERGERRRVHPNDDVNKGQSTNDVFPTAIHVATTEAFRRDVIPALTRLRDVLDEKAAAFREIVKIGRTHLQDATPLTLGQEVSGWVAQLDHAIAHLGQALPHLCELALGGTAVGTGLNAHP